MVINSLSGNHKPAYLKMLYTYCQTGESYRRDLVSKNIHVQHKISSHLNVNYTARKLILRFYSTNYSHTLSVCPSHKWISQKRCKLRLPNLHRRLPGRV